MSEEVSLLSVSAIPTVADSLLLYRIFNQSGQTNDVYIHTVQEDEHGKIIESWEQVTIAGTGAEVQKRIKLTTGRLLTATIICAVDGVVYGDYYARVDLFNQGSVKEQNRTPLTSGYFTNTKPLIFPSSEPDAASLIYPSTTQLSLVPQGPGQEVSYQAPGDERNDVIAGLLTLVTDATVAVRTVSLQISVESIPILHVTARTTQIAGLTRNYQFWIGPSLPTDVVPTIYLPLPNGITGANMLIETVTTNLSGGDEFTVASMTTRRSFNRI